GSGHPLESYQLPVFCVCFWVADIPLNPAKFPITGVCNRPVAAIPLFMANPSERLRVHLHPEIDLKS
ncbi:hypothetical protein, partial [Kaarinaea lacus]